MNDTNVSSTAVTDKTTRLMYGSISYAILGVCVFALNFPIFLAVMMYKKLREKEYIIVAGLALSDAIDGATYVVVGVSRVFLFLNHQAFDLVTRWHCMTRPWNVSWIWSYSLTGAMLLTVTIDRLIAVFLPLRYIKFTPRYSFRMCAAAYAICIAFGAVSAVDTYIHTTLVNENKTQIALCSPVLAITPHMLQLFYYIWLYPPILSVLFYVPVILKFAIKPNNATANTSQMTAARIARLKKVTKSIAICTGLTLLLRVIPNAINSYVNANTAYQSLMMFLFSLSMVNQIANFFVYAWHFEDMRGGLKALVSCKANIPVHQVSAQLAAPSANFVQRRGPRPSTRL